MVYSRRWSGRSVVKWPDTRCYCVKPAPKLVQYQAAGGGARRLHRLGYRETCINHLHCFTGFRPTFGNTLYNQFHALSNTSSWRFTTVYSTIGGFSLDHELIGYFVWDTTTVSTLSNRFFYHLLDVSLTLVVSHYKWLRSTTSKSSWQNTHSEPAEKSIQMSGMTLES